MTGDQRFPSDTQRRVVRFRRGPVGTHPPVQPVEDLAKFERGPEIDDYRHRMWVNAVVFVFVIALIGAGLWLADSMASLRRNQDCVLAGHHNCAGIEVNK